MNKIDIRRATLVDLKEITSLFVETIKAVNKTDYTKEQIVEWIKSANDLQRWEGIVRDQYFVVAELEHQIIGISSLDGDDYIDFMYVHKDFQKRGIAQCMYDHLEGVARDLGAQHLFSDVSITARPFFEKQNFVIIKQNQHERNGHILINYRMEKVL